MIRRLKNYLLGMREFRLSATAPFDDYNDLCTYDAGRDMAHRLTLRRYDEAAA